MLQRIKAVGLPACSFILLFLFLLFLLPSSTVAAEYKAVGGWQPTFSKAEQAAQEKDYPRAELLIQKLLKTSNYEAKARALHLRASIYVAQEDLQKALKAQKRALGLASHHSVPYPFQIEVKSSLAEIHGQLGNDFIAAKLYDTLVGSSLRRGDWHASLSYVIAAVEYYFLAGDYKIAKDRLHFQISLYEKQENLKAAIQSLYPDLLRLYGEALEKLGDFAESQKQYQKLYDLQVAEKDLSGAKLTLASLGKLALQLGDLRKAKKMLAQASREYQGLAEEVQNAEDFNIIQLTYAEVLEAVGDYAKAEALYLEVHAFDEQTYGELDVGTLIDLNNLGGITRKMGDFSRSESYYQEALSGLGATLGKEDVETLSIQNNLALLYENRGFYAKAEPIMQGVAKAFAKKLGKAHPKTLAAGNNLAMIYESQGRFKKAKKLYKQVEKRAKKAYGPTDERRITAINNLAYMYVIQKKYKKAVKPLAQVVALWEKSAGPEHQKTLKAKNSLARAWMGVGKYAKAGKLLQSTLQSRVKVFGEKHPDSIRSLIDTGHLYLLEKKQGKAKEAAAKALQLSVETLGELHPYSFDALKLLADAEVQLGELQAAKENYHLLFQRRNRFFELALWAASEQTRAAYIERAKPEQGAYLFLLARLQTPEAARLALEVSLERKGLLLKISSTIKKTALLSKNPALMKDAFALASLRKVLGRLILQGPVTRGVAEYHLQMQSLEQQVEKLERKLAVMSQRSIGIVKPATLAEVIQSLPKDAALVDFQEYRGKNEQGKEERNMLAVVAHWAKQKCKVFFTCSSLDIQLVPLGPVDEIEESVMYLRLAVQEEDSDEDDLVYTGEEVYNHLWKPLEALLHDTKNVYLVPDGSLHLLPFDVVPTAKKAPLGVAYNLKLVSNIQDIMAKSSSFRKGKLMIFAGPDYDQQSAEQQKVQDLEKQPLQGANDHSRSQLRSLSFMPLLGAKEEGETILKLADLIQGKSLFYSGPLAEEQRLRDVKEPPLMLHIATHGFFLPAAKGVKARLQGLQTGADEMDWQSLDEKIKPSGNPLLRAGLAFAGINQNAPFLGELAPENDGLLTAFEVLSLDLSGANLVVLSACETAVGEIHAGEGVYGLRRAFQESGATNVISSLWPVNDEATQLLMSTFYRHLFDGSTPRVALRKAQAKLRNSEDWNHPYYWAAFVLVGKR